MNLRRLLIWSSVVSLGAGLACLAWFVFYRLDAALYEERQTALIQNAAEDESPVSGVIREGADAKTLRRAVGHVPKTARPGEKGNMVLAAHRQQQFRGLRHVCGEAIAFVSQRRGDASSVRWSEAG